ncbi:MAG: L-threonylcarbamoyladenylate synthase [Candidatus Omnitrophota bacterium]
MQTKIVKVDPDNPDPNIIKQAADILKKGGIVAFPTETVYGLGADYNNKKAIDRLYNIKKRPKDKPFTIQIADKTRVLHYAHEVTPLAKKLMDEFWPGPLTIILKSKDSEKIGFRIPANKIAIELIKEGGLDIAVPSANISGRPDPVEPFSVVQAFDGLIDMVIDSGPTEMGISSTVIDISSQEPKILREGSNIDRIKAILSQKSGEIKNILVVCAGNSCRSPMAEALLKRELTKYGFDIKSAGIIAIDGLLPSEEMQEAMKRYANIDMSDFKTHRFTGELADWADIIFVMELLQKNLIIAKIPNAKNKTYVFKEFAGTTKDSIDVPDPIGHAFLAYEESFRQIEEAVKSIAKKLRG